MALQEFFSQYYDTAVMGDEYAVIRDNQELIAAVVYQSTDLILVTGIAVHPDFRRQGLASSLVRFLKTKGLGIQANVDLACPSALQFWRAQDFTLIEFDPLSGFGKFEFKKNISL